MNFNLKLAFFIFVNAVCFAKCHLPSLPKNTMLSAYQFDEYVVECSEQMKYFTQYTFGLEAPIEDEKEKIECILENKDSQVKEVVRGKIYLRPESLIHSEFGVFLRVQDFIIVKLSNLSSDERGPYISLVN